MRFSLFLPARQQNGIAATHSPFSQIRSPATVPASVTSGFRFTYSKMQLK
jgi:hypothetical protein